MTGLCVGFTYYNEGEMLTEAIRSLDAQGTHNLEILVYDDASTKSAEDYIPPDVPVRLIRGVNNRGPAHGRNVLLRESSAEYIHFHDSDDLFLPSWKQEIDVALAAGPDAVFTEILSTRKGVVQSEAVLGLAALAGHGDLMRFCIEGAMLVPAGTYRRELLLDMGGYDEDFWQSEDFDFHIRLASRSPRFTLLPQALVEIRLRSDSRSTDRLRVYRDAVKVLDRAAQWLGRSHLAYIADALLKTGRTLYQLGDCAGAANAFELARKYGPPAYVGQPSYYRLAARWLGMMNAERLASVYRRIKQALGSTEP